MKILDKNAVLSQTCDVKKLENPDFKNAIFLAKLQLPCHHSVCTETSLQKKKNHVTVREK